MKILGFIFLLFLNLVFGLSAAALYTIGMNGLGNNPTFQSATSGTSILGGYLLLLLVQIYALFLRDKGRKVQRIWVVSFSILFFAFAGISFSFVQDVYRGDNNAYKDPVFKEYSKNLKVKGITFNQSKSDAQSHPGSKHHFYFTIDQKTKLSLNTLNKLAASLPASTSKGFSFVFQKGSDTISIPFSKTGTALGCYDSSGQSNCDFFFTKPLTPLFSEVQNALAKYNMEHVDSNQKLIFRLEESQKTEKEANRKAKSLADQSIQLFLEHETGKFNEQQVKTLFDIIGEVEESTPFMIHLFAPENNSPSISFAFNYIPELGTDNGLYYETCKVSFCKDISVFYPDASKEEHRYIKQDETDEKESVQF